MNNSEKFQEVFGYYATEIWTKSHEDFLDWMNVEYVEQSSKSEGEIREMIKCVKIEDVLTCIIFQIVGKDLTCGELKKIIENLPTIEVEKEDTYENLIDKIYPVGSYYYNNYGLAVNPNDAFDDTTWECYGRYWKRIK